MTNRPEDDAILEDMQDAFGDRADMVDQKVTADEETDERDPFTNNTS